MNRFVEHFDGLLRYWERARDNEGGGFHAFISPEGRVEARGDKVLLVQARLLYNYAEGLLRGRDFCAPHGEALYACLTESLRVPDGWYVSLIDGQWQAPDGMDTYMNLFVVIGMARYAQASRRDDVGQEAWRLFRLIEEKVVDDLAGQGVAGGWGRTPDRLFPPMGMYAGNNVLHYLEAMICLRAAGWGSGLEERIEQVRRFFLTFILDEESMLTRDAFLGGFAEPDLRPGTSISLAHGLEWFGFFREAARPLPDGVEQGLLERALESGLLPSGHFQDRYYLPEKRTAGGASFWTQSEAVKAFTQAGRWFGEPYEEAAKRAADYYFDHFVDADGGVFSAVDRNGVVLSRRKGFAWKCDYHSLRMCIEHMEAVKSATNMADTTLQHATRIG